jgi:hypothetical protein
MTTQDPNDQPWQTPMPPPPAYPTGGQQYGGYPPPGQAGPPAPVPSTLDTVWWLVIANVAFGVIGLIYTLTHRQEIIDRVIAAQNVDIDAARTAANVGIVIGVLFGIGFAVFYIFLAGRIRQGKNWARITLTVFLSIGVLGNLIGLSGDNPGFNRALSGIGLVINATALVLLWLRASSAYIEARNRPSW